MQFACGHLPLPSHRLTGFKFSHKGSFGAEVGKGVGAGVGKGVGAGVGDDVGSAVGSGVGEGVGYKCRRLEARWLLEIVLHDYTGGKDTCVAAEIYLLERPYMFR